ncbi:MAG: TetR/AcrR family transcriptional regulator [Gammaproteobacteria bacterium]|nr:TetR/AcrR family transcriptional regulator [Gammaproteobacteria bacterium]MCP5198427.1 TetR/AcrR family transcriptional regulator [Gammaproteobacteria bacterium]
MQSSAVSEVERRTQAERTALSDARMLDAAVALICERGSSGTTLKDVGERAGYSRGLASYRFGNKGGLFAFLIRAIGESWLTALRGATRDKVGLAAIEAATDAHYRFVVEGSDAIRAFYILWFESTGPDAELKRVVANIHERRRRDVVAWIEKGIAAGSIDPAVDTLGTAEQFCAAIIGIVYQWLVTPDAAEHLHFLHESLKRQTARALQPPRLTEN